MTMFLKLMMKRNNSRNGANAASSITITTTTTNAYKCYDCQRRFFTSSCVGILFLFLTYMGLISITTFVGFGGSQQQPTTQNLRSSSNNKAQATDSTNGIGLASDSVDVVDTYPNVVVDSADEEDSSSDDEEDSSDDTSMEKVSGLTEFDNHRSNTNYKIEVAPTRRYHIFQFSDPHVAGSTMTTNILTGLFEGKDHAIGYLHCGKANNEYFDFDNCYFQQRLYMGGKARNIDNLNRTIVTKTHHTDISALEAAAYKYFDNIFFIGNERKDENQLLPPEYCASDTFLNVLCLDYNDLQFTDEEGLRQVVRYVKDKIQETFPYFANAQLKEEEAVERMLHIAKTTIE